MKRTSTRFSMAIHILTFIASTEEECTGDFIAHSVNSNPVTVRNVMALLKKSQLLNVRPGVGGAYLLKSPADISLYDVYCAVDLIEDDELFGLHSPRKDCAIGNHIEQAIRFEFRKAQDSMEQELRSSSIQDILASLPAMS